MDLVLKDHTLGVVRLETFRDWGRWFDYVRNEARTHGVWQICRPEANAKTVLKILNNNQEPSYADAYSEVQQQLRIQYQRELRDWQNANPEERGPEPEKPGEPLKSDVDYVHEQNLLRHFLKTPQDDSNDWRKAHNAVYHLILNTVRKDLLENALNLLTSMRQPQICCNVLRVLEAQIVPTQAVRMEASRKAFLNVLDRAETAMDPLEWIMDFRREYHDALANGVTDAVGLPAITAFLNAVQKRIAPGWAYTKHMFLADRVIRGDPEETVEVYADQLHRFLLQNGAGARISPHVHATFGGRGQSSDQQDLSKQGSDKKNGGDGKGKPSGSGGGHGRGKGGNGGRKGGDRGHNQSNNQNGKANRTPKVHYDCPCGILERHYWTPIKCLNLKAAITGKSERGGVISQGPRQRILDDLMKPQWADLRDELQARGMRLPGPGAPRLLLGPGSEEPFPGSVGVKLKLDDDKDFTGPLVKAVIPYDLWARIQLPPGIHTTFVTDHHPLHNSILLDNCGAVHIVNDKSRFEPGSWHEVDDPDDCVGAGTTFFQVQARGRWRLRNVLNGNRGPNTEDLILEDAVFIDGFHVNIVSEVALERAGLWYCGWDGTLRYGPMERSLVMRQLVRKHNLVFLEYNVRSAYSRVPPPEHTVTMSLAAIKTRLAARSKEPLPEREDTERLWHLRVGHAGPEAMRRLVSAARGVRYKVDGIPRKECESCARAHATRVISRRPSENRAIRPFWRITWDLFEFDPGFDGSKWLLVIRDEWSGRVIAKTLTTKSLHAVARQIKDTVSWVNTQFGLKVCKIRQDNDTGTIGIKGYTDYEVWIQNLGIDLELTPTHTSEANGGSERVGREIIERGLAMLLGARLPRDLWPEATKAAAWLINITPSQRNDWKSPNEKLYSWFRQYFRWYQPEFVDDRTRDLRPHLGNLYAYGCRAYPLDKRREANTHRKLFKTTERAHIGYLVGYQATNIYRIWVPQLKRVIVTRNVIFDEKLFYEPGEEHASPQPLQITRDVVELLESDTGHRDAGVVREPDDVDPESPEHSVSSERPETSSDRPEGQDSGVGVQAESAPPADAPTELSKAGSPATGLPTPRPSVSPPSPHAGLGGVTDIEPHTSDAYREGMTAEDQHPADRTVELGTPLLGPHDDDTVGLLTVEEEPLQPADGIYRPSQSAHHTVDAATRQQTTERQDPDPARIKRKYVRKVYGPAVRQSRRQRGQGPEGEDDDDEHRLVGFALGMYRDDGIYLPNQRHWESFYTTFFPDNPIHEGDSPQTRTIHCVVAAAVNQRSAKRLGAAPEMPRIHFSELANAKAPQRFRDIENHKFKYLFLEACDEEIRNLVNRKTWRIICRAEAKGRPLPLKWVFTYKFDEHGYVEKAKARICVRGDLQRQSTLETTYAATLAARTFRLMMAIAAHFDLEVHQFDVKQAFLNALLEAPVYCELPEGYKQPGKCVQLLRALYGLRESPLLWYREFSSTLRKLGLKASKEEPCLFYDDQRKVTIVFYVDDYLVFFHRDHADEANRIMNALKAKYELHEKGEAKWFLGVRIIRDRPRRRVFLVHDQYIEKVAKRFDINLTVRAPYVPLPPGDLVKHEGTASSDEIKLFQELVGSILYTAIMIRPDVAFAASKLSHFLTNPSRQHILAAYQVVHYLYGTRHLGIMYTGEETESRALLIAGDASFADCLDTRRSTQGYVMMLFGGVIVWKAARQSTVTTSSTEAELTALTSTAKETIALQRLFEDIALDLGEPWMIYCDNTNAIRLVVEDGTRISTSLRHVDIHNMWAREQVEKGTFGVEYLQTAQMPADGLTKNLSRQRFEHFRKLLNLQDTTKLVQDLGGDSEQRVN
ncbi:hypothetical protein VTJ83DRAFT_2834 [Remersonia thermophila]|uniref:Integrase catalytic domain-containing protein n=1 Tax=Remersonia thermophila TaxID=72144 RepID=A0ABR4DCC8_9PEZI